VQTMTVGCYLKYAYNVTLVQYAYYRL